MTKLTALAFVLVACAPASSQASATSGQPLDVSLCDLMREPAKYHGKVVRVRGRVSIAFEDFSLDSSECGYSEESREASGIWLNYGGDESAPTIYCCGDHSRKPGEYFKFQGKPIPLFRDVSLVEFRKRITARRQVRPDGLSCYGRECYLYDVTATITGHFLAIEKTKDGALAGYGHLGCCHLLFIERVKDVEARRTDVPAGGIFDCRSEAWDVPLSEAHEVLSNYHGCVKSGSCKDARWKAVVFAARHWGQSADDVRRWTGEYRDEADYMWSSPNFRTIYTLKFPYTNTHLKRSRANFVISRSICSETTNSLPESTPVFCEEINWDSENPQKTARRLQKKLGAGGQRSALDLRTAAWAAVEEVVRERGVELSSHLVLESCMEHEMDKDEQGYCRWTSKDGMQDVTAYLTRYGFLRTSKRPKSQTVWVSNGVNLTVCGPD